MATRTKVLLRVGVVVIVSLLAVFAGHFFFASQKPAVPFSEDVSYMVSNVLDGDTFAISLGDNSPRLHITIRMLGIDTPETVDPRKPPECFGKEASAETKKLLSHSLVRLKLNPDREVKDKYGRYLAYVYKDDLFVNEYLVEKGFAREYTFGKAYSEQRNFRKIEGGAKREKKGLWGRCR